MGESTGLGRSLPAVVTQQQTNDGPDEEHPLVRTFSPSDMRMDFIRLHPESIWSDTSGYPDSVVLLGVHVQLNIRGKERREGRV